MKSIITISLFTLYFFIGPQSLFCQLCVGTPGQVQWCYWRAIPDDEMGELHAKEFFPERPDGQLILNSLKTPYRFDNYYGSFVRGYIQVPLSESIVFNLTGDDRADFYLSTDDQKSNLQKIAYLVNYTGEEEHDKDPEQTSVPIPMTAGQYYYFELHHVDSGGGDHATVWWKTSFTSLINWNFISTDYIYDVACLGTPCQERGTPCNDGDPTTSNDQYDGFCHCIGIPATANSCVGQPFNLATYYYDSIPGNYLEDLYEAVNFPTLPNRGENLNILGKYRENVFGEFGTMVQGFLTVPVSGGYKFNITGDNQTIFFLSSDDDPVNKQAHQILTDYSTGMTEHDDQIYQSTSFIQMEAGQYYYFEINHKQGGSYSHFRVFWQTPFGYGTDWKEIPAIYLYDYDCELACIPQGTPCDDGDPFTNDDQYDANCTCLGIPCSGPDCDDPIANYVPFEACGLTSELDNRDDHSWLSCSTSASSNPARGPGHWLEYDLGAIHRLFDSQIWNYNVTGQLTNGINSVAIDYSDDGVLWSELGVYNWPDATGTDDYAGFVGPDFGGVQARYILITSLDNQPCSGMSKIAITARECGPEGSVCDDGNPFSYGDKFDEDCNCIGAVGNPLDCLIDSLILGDSLLLQSNYSAIKFLESKSTVIQNSDVTFRASESIELNPGFVSEEGGMLSLQLESCTTNNELVSAEFVSSLKSAGENEPLIVSNIAKENRQEIAYYVASPGKVSLVIIDEKGQLVETLADHTFRNGGHYKKRINTKKMSRGIYSVRLQTTKHSVSEKMSVMDLR